MVKLPYWGWVCNSSWSGFGNAFKLAVPTNSHLVVQGCLYNPTYKQIEIWGYLTPNKKLDTEYNDVGSSQGTSGSGGRQSGRDGTREDEPHKSQESCK
jgi:hypothetical protein